MASVLICISDADDRQDVCTGASSPPSRASGRAGGPCRGELVASYAFLPSFVHVEGFDAPLVPL
eukprot:7257283-Alexandrium_andersonii.AAC.1